MSKEKIKQKNYTSHSNKGITLIALIITIIVMLVLVAVTLIIALGENGIIEKTIQAKEERDLAAFKECVEIAAAGAFKKNETTGYYMYNWDDFKTEVTTADNGKYRNATFMYLISGMTPIDIEFEDITKNIRGHQEILEYIERNKLASNYDISSNANHKGEIQRIVDTWGLEPITNWKVTWLELRCDTNILLYGSETILVECDGMQATVGLLKMKYQDYMIIMKRSEADNLFSFTPLQDGGGDYPGGVTTIASYKGNAKHVDVPGIIIEDDGSYTYVTGIEANAFEKGGIKWPALNAIGFEDPRTYNTTSTLAEFKAELLSVFSQGTDDLSLQAVSIIENYNCLEGDTCTKISCKNDMLKGMLILAGSANNFPITEQNADEYLAYDEEGKMYILMNNNYQPVTSAQFVESKTVSIKISEGIEEIGEEAFKNCSKLETIYIPSSIWGSRMSSDAFEGCTSLTQITTGESSIAESTKNWGCPNTITKTYINLFE